MPKTIEEKRAAYSKYYYDHHETSLENARRSRERHHDKIRASARERYRTLTADEREKLRAYNRARYQTIKQKESDRKRKAREADIEKYREQKRLYNRAWRTANRERDRASQIRSNARRRTKYAEDPSKMRADAYAWRKANPEKSREMVRTYHRSHPEKLREGAERRRARQANAPLNDLTDEQWQEIKAAYDSRCVYCHKKMQRLTKDHIIPLAKGGSHTASNIVPACKSCNSRKSAGAPIVPVQPLLFTIAPKRKPKPKVS